MVPLAGASRIASGTISVTKAMTHRSVFNCLKASMAFRFLIRRNCNTGMS
jgi:hypothetical protein